MIQDHSRSFEVNDEGRLAIVAKPYRRVQPCEILKRNATYPRVERPPSVKYLRTRSFCSGILNASFSLKKKKKKKIIFFIETSYFRQGMSKSA